MRPIIRAKICICSKLRALALVFAVAIRRMPMTANYRFILIGSLGGILAASKLMNYRIEQLEKKVDKHNNVVERIAVVEVKLSDQALELKRIHQVLNVE